VTPVSAESKQGVPLNEVEAKFWDAWSVMPAAKMWDLEPQVGTVARGSTYRFDFADRDRMYGVEVDGKHSHSGQQAFRYDRKRQRDLEFEGWRLVRFAAMDVYLDPVGCAIETHVLFVKFGVSA
jgi:REase_MTES_1575